MMLLLAFVTSEEQHKPNNCHPDLPFMSVGDFNITKDNFEKLIKREQYLLIQLTSPYCENCCPYEAVIKDMRDMHLRNSSSGLFNKFVKIGRIDVSEEKWFAEMHPTLKELPNWIMYIRGEAFYLQQTNFINRLLNTLRRLVEPFIEITNLKQFEELLVYSKKDISGRHMVRNKVFGLFADKDDYEEIVDNLKETALRTYWREDTVYGICTKPAVVKEIFVKYGTKYVPNQYDKNTIFLLKEKNRFAHSDLLKHYDIMKPIDISKWLAATSISPLEEMTSLNQMSFSTAAPMIIAFVDPRDESRTQAFLDDISQLGTKYLNRVNFVWVDYRDNLILMQKLGLEGASVPCVGLSGTETKRGVFVLDKKQTLKNIEAFVDGFFEDKIAHLDQSTRVQEGQKQAKAKTQLLSNLKKLEYLDFHAYLQDPNVDIAVFLFNSSSPTTEEFARRTEIMGRLAHSFRENFAFNSLLIASYDIAKVRLDQGFQSASQVEIDTVYMIPAGQNSGPFTKFNASNPEDFTAKKIAQFIMQHAKYGDNTAEALDFAEELDQSMAKERSDYESRSPESEIDLDL